MILFLLRSRVSCAVNPQPLVWRLVRVVILTRKAAFIGVHRSPFFFCPPPRPIHPLFAHCLSVLLAFSPARLSSLSFLPQSLLSHLSSSLSTPCSDAPNSALVLLFRALSFRLVSPSVSLFLIVPC
ncbi:hypothetical protein BDW62DRAFT_169313 [Aspergillus aurantiobrunneus]